MSKLYMTYGYPIAVVSSSDKKINGYVIEKSPGEMIELNSDEALAWAKLLTIGESDNINIINILKSKKVLFCGNSISELFDQILNLFPIRQGIGVAEPNDVVNEKTDKEKNAHISIKIGGKSYKVTSFQNKVWQLSDGNKSLKDILELCEINFSIEKMKEMLFLMYYGLIYFREQE